MNWRKQKKIRRKMIESYSLGSLVVDHFGIPCEIFAMNRGRHNDFYLSTFDVRYPDQSTGMITIMPNMAIDRPTYNDLVECIRLCEKNGQSTYERFNRKYQLRTNGSIYSWLSAITY